MRLPYKMPNHRENFGILIAAIILSTILYCMGYLIVLCLKILSKWWL